MRHVLSLSLVAVALATACPPPLPPPDAGNPQICDEGVRVCDNDRLCGGGFCDKVDDGDNIPEAEDQFGCCQLLICQSNDDCEETEKCDVRRGICVPLGLCDPASARGGECEQRDGTVGPCCAEGELCQYEAGEPECVAQPDPAAACFVALGGRPLATAPGDTENNPGIAKAGEPIQLEAVGTSADGKLIAHTTFTWAGAGVDAASGVLTGACGAGVCAVTVTATTVNGGATCDGVVNVYAAPTLAQRIILVDQTTGAPIANADTASTIGGVATAGTPTNADGVAEFAVAPDAVSAFPDGHQWHTIVGPPADVIIYTSPLPNNDEVAGIKGTFNFDSVSTIGDIKLGLSGTAIAASITDLNFETLIGDIADYNVDIEGVTEPGGQVVPLPSGLVIELGAEPIKGDYVTFGEPGKNVAWAIGGQVRLAEIGEIISSVAGSSDVNVGAILGAVLPFFATFDHALVSGGDLNNLELGTRPADPADDSPIPFEQWPFDVVELEPNTLLSQSAKYDMPSLPCSPGRGVAPACSGATEGSSYATGTVLLSGVIVPGIGLVPLGLTAGLDDPDSDDGDDFDGQLDYDSDTPGGPGKGEALIDYAPPHDGLEGNIFVTVAIALDINSIAGGTDGFGASILTHITPKFGATNNFTQASFLESQGGTFTPGEAGSFTLISSGTADFYRVNFDDGGDTEWNVWFEPDFAGPIEPADFHPTAAEAAARFQHADVQAFRLGTGYDQIADEPTDFADLFAFNGTNLDNLLYYLGAWSSEACKFEGHCTDTAAPPPEE